jgi:uncharacterized protein YkwD
MFPPRFLYLAVGILLGLAILPGRADLPGPQVEKETFALLNQDRAQHGLAPLRWSDAIAEIARAHSRDMATGACDFGHDGFKDRVHRAEAALAGSRGFGENVFMTDNPAQVPETAAVVWLKSPHHRENIRGDYNVSGLGVFVNERGEIYLTQFFVKVEASP